MPFRILPMRLAVGLAVAEPPAPADADSDTPVAATTPADNDISADIRPGFTPIASVAELHRAMAADNQRIRMKPGVYRITDAAPDNRTVFLVTGSDNHFDLRGVTLQVDTQVLADLGGRVHSLATYRVSGSRLTFEGARFENIGDHPPFRSLSEFRVTGDDVTFRDCRFVIRGSAAYGYGDLYGKGGGSAVRLQKHSAIHVSGDRTLIEDCDFRIHTFGHGMHGAQDTVIRNVTMEGELRRTCELYEEEEGLAARFAYQIMHPPWHKGRPIPRNRMLSLTEDGIRTYVRGTDREGNRRRTGHITVENCTIKRMRGGISIGAASGGTIADSTVLDAGCHAYALPSDGVGPEKGSGVFSERKIRQKTPVPFSSARPTGGIPIRASRLTKTSSSLCVGGSRPSAGWSGSCTSGSADMGWKRPGTKTGPRSAPCIWRPGI